MANYNSGFYYNTMDETGIFYNSAPYVVILRLVEQFKVKETAVGLAVKNILKEKLGITTEEQLKAEHLQTESVLFSDKATTIAMLEVFDTFGVKDEMGGLFVQAFLKDDFKMLDEFKQFTEFALSEKVNLKETPDLYSFLAVADRFGVKDFPHIEALLKLYDTFKVSDRQPKTAISDFIIGATEDFDTAYDWLLPFGLKIDWSKTNLPSMPEAELTTVEIPSVDGSIVEDAVYKDRMFQIVSYSEQGLTKSEKQQIKSKIAKILDTTKKKAKKLTIQNTNTSFDVRYDGQASITEGSSYIKATIPFRTSPYGYSTFEEEMFGNGVIKNEGDMEIYPVTTINGYCTNPVFEINGVSYFYNNTVPKGGKLVVDHAMKSVYIIDSNGERTNAMKDFHTQRFAKIEVNSSAWVYAENTTVASLMVNTWRKRVLW